MIKNYGTVFTLASLVGFGKRLLNSVKNKVNQYKKNRLMRNDEGYRLAKVVSILYKNCSNYLYESRISYKKNVTNDRIVNTVEYFVYVTKIDAPLSGGRIFQSDSFDSVMKMVKDYVNGVTDDKKDIRSDF